MERGNEKNRSIHDLSGLPPEGGGQRGWAEHAHHPLVIDEAYLQRVFPRLPVEPARPRLSDGEKMIAAIGRALSRLSRLRRVR